jgi:2-polyprenyl-3-methyl-5-hydroxy-6-metoxy-1,4-benzoquinol methylase
MITTWSAGQPDDHMVEEILIEQAGLIRMHPWWRARAQLTLALLSRLGVYAPARVLDAGCGWGVNLAALEQRGYSAVGMDISRRALEMLDRERCGRGLVEADLSRSLPDGLEPYDAVLALDVIEHLDDDRAAIERLGELTSPGGVVIVSVPALPEMFSEFDRIQGHRRRYLPETLRRSFAGTALVLEQIFWWGAWLVPVLHHQRRRPLQAAPRELPSRTYGRYLRLPPWPIPVVFRIAFALEQRPSLAGKLTTGTSLFAVARRQAAPIGARLAAPARSSRDGMVTGLARSCDGPA